MNVLRCDRNDVRTRYGSQPDEVVHGFISDDEGRVAMWIVLKELSASDHKGIKINADVRKNGRKSAIWWCTQSVLAGFWNENWLVLESNAALRCMFLVMNIRAWHFLAMAEFKKTRHPRQQWQSRQQSKKLFPLSEENKTTTKTTMTTKTTNSQVVPSCPCCRLKIKRQLRLQWQPRQQTAKLSPVVPVVVKNKTTTVSPSVWKTKKRCARAWMLVDTPCRSIRSCRRLLMPPPSRCRNASRGCEPSCRWDCGDSRAWHDAPYQSCSLRCSR